MCPFHRGWRLLPQVGIALWVRLQSFNLFPQIMANRHLENGKQEKRKLYLQKGGREG